ncbi:MAG: M50 family metallopeptidase [Halothermotrichaceae bacterium]
MGINALTLRVNPLFLLIIILFALVGLFQEALTAFLLVFLHECVHLLVAYYSGFGVNKIELFPFGGMAEYTGLLEMEPVNEIKVALSGPLFNLLLAGFFYFLSSNIIQNNPILGTLVEYNLIIASVNLIPALPLDGGRVIRALFVLRYGFKRGNTLAAGMARVIAIIGIIIGFLVLLFNQSNLWFLFFSFFVYGAVVKEKKQIIYYLLSYLTHRKKVIKKIKIKNISAQIIKNNLVLKEVIYHINPAKYNLFFVLSSDFKLEGILTESEIIKSFFEQDKNIKKISDLL